MRILPELPLLRSTSLRRRLVAIALSATLAVAAPLIAAQSAAAAAATVLAPQASPSGFPVGTGVYDTATLGQGVNPTGSLTFTLYAPSDPACAAPPVFTSTVAVAGNGYYSSASFTTAVAGTYRWIARYGGDAQNSPATTACADPAQAVSMGKRTPTLNGTASAPSATGSITDSAVLGLGVSPTGTITFSLYGPDNLVCSGPPIFTAQRTVAGNGTFTSPPFTPTTPGTYMWTTAYSGDANNNGARTICSDSAQDVIISAPPAPTTTTTTRPPVTTTTAPAPTTTTTTRPPVTTTTAPAPTTTTTTRPPVTTTTAPAPTTTTTRPAPTTTRPAPTTTAPPAGPSQTVRFVDRAHRDLLGRAPSSGESSFWVDVLAGGFSRDNMAIILTTSNEFRRLVVNSYYQSYLGRPGEVAEVDSFVRLIEQDGWTFEYVATLLLGSDEFYLDHGASPATYVDALYARVLGVPADAAGRGFWVDRMAEGMDRYTVALAFLSTSMAHEQVVRLTYSWLLDRAPDAAGLSFWTNQLDDGLRQEYVFGFFVGSGEYWSKS